jgi:UDP-N-acetylglucosamine 2-epimerase
MLDQVMDLFGMSTDHDLSVMRPGQTLAGVTTAILQGLDQVLEREAPDWVLVHGDTTTALSAALGAFYRQIPVGHVEAGLRTGQKYAPFPEEINRSVVGRIATAHFAPTQGAKANLLAEGISESAITVTGNTVIDALQWLRSHRLSSGSDAVASAFDHLDPRRKLILVTGHRRESFDGGLKSMCVALRQLAERGDAQIVYPVHLNPVVQDAVRGTLEGVPNVFLEEPQEYLPFVWLMSRAHLIITDSGGIQEEAPSLGVPVLVTREVTERPEAVAAGVVRLVGTSTATIFDAASELLDDEQAHARMSAAQNPYGDGHAAARTLEVLRAS